MIACSVIIAIIIIAIVFLILLKTRTQKRRAKVSNKIVVLNEDELGNADTEVGLKARPVVSNLPTSLPNRDINKDNNLETQDDINVVGIGTGRTTNRSDLGSALALEEIPPKEEEVIKKVKDKVEDAE